MPRQTCLVVTEAVCNITYSKEAAQKISGHRNGFKRRGPEGLCGCTYQCELPTDYTPNSPRSVLCHQAIHKTDASRRELYACQKVPFSGDCTESVSTK